jgi:hypothetical protein
MPTDKRDPRRFRRQRDALLERLYDAAKDERRRLAGQLSAEFREAVDALEDLDASEEETR